MDSIECMICRGTETSEFFNISHQNGRSTIKSDIIELCGSSIQDYLQEEDVVCTKCMKFLHSCSEMKLKLCEIIVNRSPLSQYVNDSRVEREYSPKPRGSGLSNVPSTSTAFDYEGPIETPSPNNLLVPTSSIPYDERSDTPSLDREVQYVNSMRRRRRGHNWSRRKGSTSRDRSKSASVYRARNNPSSRASQRTGRATHTGLSHRQQMIKHSEEMQMRRILRDFLYQNEALSQFTKAYLGNTDCSEEELADILTKPVTRTRFARDMRDKFLGEFEKFIFECPKRSCNETLYSLEDLTKHMVTKHKETAWFRCEQCKFSYLTKAHLDRHMEKHYANFEAYCIFCSEEFKNKKLYEEHLNEHLVHSFPCIYCDRFFLTRQKCDIHVREQHPGKKKKIKRMKPQSILDRIDKNSGPSPSQEDEDYQEPEFVIKILTQPGPTSDDSIPDLMEGYNNINGHNMEHEPIINNVFDQEPQPSTSRGIY